MKEYIFINDEYPGVEITIRANNEESAFDKLEVMVEANDYWLTFVKWGYWELASTSE